MRERETSAQNANMVNFVGSMFSADLRRTMEMANGAIGLELKFRYDDTPENLLRRSDQWAFLEKGIPVVIRAYRRASGLSPARATPRTRSIIPKMEKIVKLIYVAVEALGNAEGRPRFERSAGKFGNWTIHLHFKSEIPKSQVLKVAVRDDYRSSRLSAVPAACRSKCIAPH